MPGGLVQVLDRQAARRGTARPRGSAATRLLGADGDEGVQLGVEPLDPLEVELDELARARPRRGGRAPPARSRSGRRARPLAPLLDRRPRSPGPPAAARAYCGYLAASSSTRARIVDDPRRRRAAAPTRAATSRPRSGRSAPRPAGSPRCSRSRCSAPRALRLLVDRRVERVAVEREADRDDVRAALAGRRSRAARRARVLRRRQGRAGRAVAGRRRRAVSTGGLSGSASGGAPNEAATRSAAGVAVQRRPLPRHAAGGADRLLHPLRRQLLAVARARPRARSTRSSASRRGRCTPARSAAAAPSRPSFTHEAWMFVIQGCSASRATACTSSASRNVGPERARPFR